MIRTKILIPPPERNDWDHSGRLPSAALRRWKESEWSTLPPSCDQRGVGVAVGIRIMLPGVNVVQFDEVKCVDPAGDLRGPALSSVGSDR